MNRKFSFVVDKRTYRITEDSPAFVVAEIGHNHGGSVEMCKRMIEAAAGCGCAAVKLQKRSNRSLFTEKLYSMPYDNENSYGATYGEHREALEFNREQYLELIRYCKEIDIAFFATAFDEESVDFLCEIEIPIIKIQSGDCENVKLLRYVANTGRACIISTGGCEYSTANKARKIFNHPNVALLHCVSQYPTLDERVNLFAIKKLMEKNKHTLVGFSSHSNGLLASVAAYIQGARIIEQHFTIDRSLKGSDHAMSLDCRGMSKLCSYLRRLDQMIKPITATKRYLDDEIKNSLKLRKSLYFNKDIKKGDKISFSDIDIRSPKEMNGESIININNIIGNIAAKDFATGDLIAAGDFDKKYKQEESKCQF